MPQVETPAMFITTSMLPCARVDLRRRGRRPPRGRRCRRRPREPTRPPAALDLGDDLLERARRCRSGGARRPSSRGGQRRRAADAAGGAGDQAALAAEVLSTAGAIGRRCSGSTRERVQGHRQHLVVADQHAELDQLDLVELGRQPLPELVADLARSVQLVGGARAASTAAPTSPAPSAPSRTRSISSALEPGAPARSARDGPTRTRSRCCGRRAGSPARCPSAAACRPASAPPANQSQRRNSPRWRASVVKMCGGRPPVARPSSLAIPALTQADLRGAIRAGSGASALPTHPREDATRRPLGCFG